MEWRPCPRCDSELDTGSGSCPVCLWEPVPQVVVAPEPDIPYLERYRGTRYAVASARPRRRFIVISRTRVLVTVGLMAVAALYGAIVMVSDTRAGQDQPPAPPGLVLIR